jgi:hypothetical protein
VNNALKNRNFAICMKINKTVFVDAGLFLVRAADAQMGDMPLEKRITKL